MLHQKMAMVVHEHGKGQDGQIPEIAAKGCVFDEDRKMPIESKIYCNGSQEKNLRLLSLWKPYLCVQVASLISTRMVYCSIPKSNI